MSTNPASSRSHRSAWDCSVDLGLLVLITRDSARDPWHNRILDESSEP